jgi:hypothetical protein
MRGVACSPPLGRSAAAVARRHPPRQLLAAARPGHLVGRSPRSRNVTGLPRVPRTLCRRTPDRWRYRGIVAESSLQSARDVYRWELRRARGPRDTRSKRRLADAAVASRAGAWTWWYPSREAGLRPRSWTSRALLAKGCLDDSALPLLIRRSPTARAGQPPELFAVRRSWSAAGIHRGRAPTTYSSPDLSSMRFLSAIHLLSSRRSRFFFQVCLVGSPLLYGL